jgi:hypothetical protein
VSARGPRVMAPWRAVRRTCYTVARAQGNWGVWIELVLAIFGDGSPGLAARKVIRRAIYRRLGRLFSRELFGRGIGAKAIKHLLGL